MSKEWDKKVAGAMMKKRKETEYAIMSEDRSRRSWSAAHPAYAGTSLCADFKYRRKERDANGQDQDYQGVTGQLSKADP